LPRLREARELRGWSQGVLAEKAGVSRDSISNYETGHREAYPATARKLADALDVDIADLIEEVVLGIGVTPEEAAENFERQLYAPAKIAQGWHQLAQLFSDELEKVEKGDSSAGSLENLIDMLEYGALGMEALAAAEKRELRVDYDDEDTVRSKAVLRPVIDRLFVLVGDALRKIDREQLEVKAESAGKLKRLEHHFKRAS
jgi:transcriptional regulator with XRE-family HTH domain